MEIKQKQPPVVYMRNFVFGVEDSLVSTVGLLSGVAVAGSPRATILLTGLVLIFVEALSMGVGSFLAEDSVSAYVRSRVAKHPQMGGLVMFVSYFISGFIPLAPYVFFEPHIAFWISIGLTFAALFALGILSGVVLKMGVIKRAFKMLIFGGITTVVGVVVGVLFT